MVNDLANTLRGIILHHLAKLEEYAPAHGRNKTKLDRAALKGAFSDDPLYSIFGLDSPEYLAAALAGGTITSIHRKIGDAYEESVRTIFAVQYGLDPSQVTYSAPISSGDARIQRTLDLYFQLASIPNPRRREWRKYAREQLARIAKKPRVAIEAIGFEVRHCYQSADSKRAQADDALARRCIVSGILPIMLIFCLQSNQSILARYRSFWILSEGHDSYALVRERSGFDFYAFLVEHRDEFRRPVVEALRRIRTDE
jgi:hypothetical protein